MDCCAHAFRFIQTFNLFAAPRHYSPDGRVQHTVERFQQALLRWYEAQKQQNPERVITEITEITVGMTRTEKKHKPIMNVKGAECKWLCFFIADLFAEKVGSGAWPIAAPWRALFLAYRTALPGDGRQHLALATSCAPGPYCLARKWMEGWADGWTDRWMDVHIYTSTYVRIRRGLSDFRIF